MNNEEFIPKDEDYNIPVFNAKGESIGKSCIIDRDIYIKYNDGSKCITKLCDYYFKSQSY